jgi:flavin reductase (DIM6/NTAB) family NADH-FMN oxidoreductase RutF
MPSSAPPSIDGAALRRLLRTTVSGVTIVTTIDADRNPRGLTANSFTSVSLEPALVLVCIARSAGSFPAFLEARNFAVNILCESQIEISQRFASRLPDKFCGVRYRSSVGGAPIISGSLAWLDCRRYDGIEAGDHLILIGEVLAFDHRDARPLGYCGGQYIRVDGVDNLPSPEARDPASHATVSSPAHPLPVHAPHNGGRHP